MLATMNATPVPRRSRRRNVRLAIVIAVLALVFYLGLWLKAVL